MDFLIIKEKESILSQRAALVEIKNDLLLKVKELGIKEGVASKFNSGILRENIIEDIGIEKFKTRSELTKKIVEIEKKLSPLKKRLREIHELENVDKNHGKYLKDILQEIFSNEQLYLIFNELHNRELGLPPTKVSIGIDNSINNKQSADQYRKIAQASIDALILVRKNITSVIDDGCSRFDKGYFLQCISPLNRVIPPLSELDKIKRNNHLK